MRREAPGPVPRSIPAKTLQVTGLSAGRAAQPRPMPVPRRRCRDGRTARNRGSAAACRARGGGCRSARSGSADRRAPDLARGCAAGRSRQATAAGCARRRARYPDPVAASWEGVTALANACPSMVSRTPRAMRVNNGSLWLAVEVRISGKLEDKCLRSARRACLHSLGDLGDYSAVETILPARVAS
jgi:hypothetical protein